MQKKWYLSYWVKRMDIDDIFMKMYDWVSAQNYEGYDPYDWGCAPISRKFPYFLNLFFSQLNLYSPINLRKFWKIKKGTSNKSLALFAQAYLNYYLVSKNQKFLDEAIKVLDMLEKNSIKTDEGVGWASYYFVFIRKGHILSPEQIDIIATTEALKAYSAAYGVTKNEKYMGIADKIIREILSDFVGNYKEWIYI